MKTRDKVAKLDKNLRHKSGVTANDFVAAYCPMLREHAYATKDDSINEMEKTLTHTVGVLIFYKRFAEILGFNSDFDVRDFVNEYEDNIDRAEKDKKYNMAEHLQGLLAGASSGQNPTKPASTTETQQ